MEYEKIPDVSQETPEKEIIKTVGIENTPLSERGLIEMDGLLKSPDFQRDFIATQSQPEYEKLKQAESAVKKHAKSIVDTVVDETTLESLKVAGKIPQDATLSDAKKLGKEWGAARKVLMQVSMDVLGEKLSVSLDAALEIAQQQSLKDENLGFLTSIDAAKETVASAELREQANFASLTQDFEAHRNDPRFAAALEVWGISPNAASAKGSDGTLEAHHAGIVHYFEYRTVKDKNNRYAYNPETAPISVDGFIDYTEALDNLVEQATSPEQNPHILGSCIIEDEMGQKRLFMLSNANGRPETIIGFQRVGEDRIRVVSVVPGGDTKAMLKKIEQEIASVEKGRLNALSEQKHITYISPSFENN